MSVALQTLAPGFAQPVDDAQATFRAVLRALSRPGRVTDCERPGPAVAGLMPATVAVLLALTDHETPVWWCTGRGEHAAWLQFHTGAPRVDAPGEAVFAVTTAHDPLPALSRFSAGSDAAPERSATLLIELPSWDGGAARSWAGPGLKEPRVTTLPIVHAGFWTEWAHNHAGFPSGVDVLFICGHQLMGLPRTTAVTLAKDH